MDQKELALFTKIDESSPNNYDKKGYLFSQTTNVLSLAYLLLLTPALFVEKYLKNKKNHTHSTPVHFPPRLKKGGF